MQFSNFAHLIAQQNHQKNFGDIICSLLVPLRYKKCRNNLIIDPLISGKQKHDRRNLLFGFQQPIFSPAPLALSITLSKSLDNLGHHLQLINRHTGSFDPHGPKEFNGHFLFLRGLSHYFGKELPRSLGMGLSCCIGFYIINRPSAKVRILYLYGSILLLGHRPNNITIILSRRFLIFFSSNIKVIGSLRSKSGQ